MKWMKANYMLFLSEQLPDANYSPKNSKNMEKNKNNNTINNTTKSTKNSLPNITSNSHYNATNEENTSESSNKMLNKYNIVENSSKSKLPVNKNLENKKVIIKPEKAITSVNNSNNITKKNYKEVLHSIDQELVNILPSHRLYQQKKPSIKKDKNVLRYLDGIGGNLYSRYAHQIETNKYTNNTNRNRVNLYHKHSNGNNPYLPSIYKNKYTNSVNKYTVKKKY